MPSTEHGEPFRFSVDEFSGALGDLGTLLPLMLGVIGVVGLAPVPVLLGFAVFYIVTAWYYRLPIPVQPMKAMAAVLLTAQLTPASLAVSGVMIGAVLVLLGTTGWINKLACAVPQSVLSGLQLGLGGALAFVGLDLMAQSPFIGFATFAILVAASRFPIVPSALLGLLVAIGLAWFTGNEGTTFPASTAVQFAMPSLPSPEEMRNAFGLLVLPQLSLTLTNAVLLTALIAGDYFGERASHVTPRRLSISSGIANLVLAPLGAMPMCHGAGGLAAHYRFGARSGTAPLLLGLALLLLALLPGGLGPALIAAIPVAGLGALLLMTSGELAVSKRLFDSRPSCWPVIAVTAGATLWLDPFWGLLAGSLTEVARQIVVRSIRHKTDVT